MKKYFYCPDNSTGYHEFCMPPVEAASDEEAMQVIYEAREQNWPILVSVKGWDDIQGVRENCRPDFIILPWLHPDFPRDIKHVYQQCLDLQQLSAQQYGAWWARVVNKK